MTHTVNRHFISCVLDPYMALGDVDGEDEKYEAINVNDEIAVKDRIIRPAIVPYLRRFRPEALARVKLALAYGLSDSRTRFESIYDAYMLPFEAPDNPRDFFVWIWEECFSGENYRIDTGKFELNDDLDELTWMALIDQE